MKSQLSVVFVLLAIFFITACDQTASKQVSKPDTLKPSAPVNREQPITGIAGLAKKQFNDYLPKLEDSDRVVSSTKIFTGDFTGDGKDDAAIYYVMLPRDGGNMIVGEGLVLYRGQDNGLQLLKQYIPNYPFYCDTIKNGKIYLYKTEWHEGEPYCCPKTKHHIELSLKNDAITEKKVK